LRGKGKSDRPLLTAAYNVEKFARAKNSQKSRSYSCEENIGLHFIILLKCKMYRRLCRRRKPIVILQVYVNIFL